MFSFASSIMKNIVLLAFPAWARFLVKLICCIALGSAPIACCLLTILLFTLIYILLSFYSIYQNNLIENQ